MWKQNCVCTLNVPIFNFTPSSVTCGMIVSRDRRSWSPILAISTPSTMIRPPALSRIRNKAKVSVDLPAPVRPTIPTWKHRFSVLTQCSVTWRRENGCDVHCTSEQLITESLHCKFSSHSLVFPFSWFNLRIFVHSQISLKICTKMLYASLRIFIELSWDVQRSLRIIEVLVKTLKMFSTDLVEFSMIVKNLRRSWGSCSGTEIEYSSNFAMVFSYNYDETGVQSHLNCWFI